MTTDIEKNTYQDKRNILAKAINSTNGYTDSYTIDFDDNYVYFEKYKDGSGYHTYRAKYTYNGTNATISDSVDKVVRTTDYKVVVEKSLEERMMGVIEKFFGGSQKNEGKPVIKQFDEEQMIAIEPLYIAAEGIDGVGDTISLEDTYGMVDSLNECVEKGLVKSNLFHKVNYEAFTIVKAWVNECECMIGDHLVPEGQPLVKIKFNNEKAWELRKSGKLQGLSIGARAKEIEILE